MVSKALTHASRLSHILSTDACVIFEVFTEEKCFHTGAYLCFPHRRTAKGDSCSKSTKKELGIVYESNITSDPR